MGSGQRAGHVAMKAYAVVVTAALLLAVAYIWQQNREAQERTAAQQKTVTAASLQEQKTCADQAKKDFVDGGWRLDGGILNGFLASYTDHYAPALNRCFYELYTLGGAPNPSTSYIIFDAFEVKDYAHYSTMYSPSSQSTVDGM